MDYREFIEKYGSSINKALTDKEYIAWLIKLLKLEGFGTAKNVDIVNGLNNRAVTVAETETDIIFRIDEFKSTPPVIISTVIEGDDYEWGKQILPADITVDITVVRKQYSLASLNFDGLDEADKTLSDINNAGVNNNLQLDYTWIFNAVPSLTTLSNGDSNIGTVTAVDAEGQTTVHTVSINRKDRWFWGVTQNLESVATLADLLETVTGNIVPADGDPNFRSLTTGIGTLPETLAVDTFGSKRTFFTATIPEITLELETGYPYNVEDVIDTINLNSASGGVANVSRNYKIKTVELNTVVTFKTS